MSVANDARTGEALERIEAVIDWDMVESVDTLDKLPTGAIDVKVLDLTRGASGGTTITLRKMRRRWTPRDLVRFVVEANATIPPTLLSDTLPSSITKTLLLFERPVFQSPRKGGRAKDPGWGLDLEGDFDVGDAYWRALGDQATWVVEIDANRERVKYVIAPTVRRISSDPDLEPFESSLKLEKNDEAPAFQARILIREGGVVAGQPVAVRTWIQETHGIRLYMEGFRVLPYGEVGDDWLQIDRMYAERSRATDQISASLFSGDGDDDLGLVTIPNKQYLGAVFLTSEGASGLQMLVNREGFVPNSAFLRLQDLVRAGIGLATRVRAAANSPAREARRKQRALKGGKQTAKTSTQRVTEAVGDAAELLQGAKRSLSSGDAGSARAALAALETLFEDAGEASKDIADEQAMVRILASLGTQSAGFVHEINGLLGLANALEKSVNSIRAELNDVEARRFGSKLARVSAQLVELRLTLERQASYLTEIVGPDKRRRRSRQDIRKRFDTAYKLLAQHAEKHAITFKNSIPEDLRSPPMFGAELVAVFTNLLTNAVKAVGRRGDIVATGKEMQDRTVRVRLENTGKRVTVSAAEKWFLPFTSTTNEADPLLGLGMGLGLPITRRILDEYDATIAFVDPSKDYSTAVEIRFKKV
jgi:signal transduction histidine kinase